MKKRKLLFAAAMLMFSAGAWAQTDVTSTYITNPSFEKDGSITASASTLTITGWTQSNPGNQYNNTGCYNATTNIPTQGTVTVTPSAGDYFLYYRHGWNGTGTTCTFTSSETTLPSGVYTLSVDYKMVEGYDDSQKNNTKVTIAAVSGENTLGSATGTTKTNVSGGNNYTYLNTANWSTATADFTLEDETSNVNFVLTLLAGGQRRSDFVIDNVKLLYTAFVDPTEITLDNTSLSMIPTAKKTVSVSSYTPAGANHNLAITWLSSNESVATVSSEGQVTAVAPGTATITATTANGMSATCDITVNAAPLVDGDYYVLNVSKGGYLGGANTWGTQASVINHGIPFTVTLTNGGYTFDSKTYNNKDQHYLNGTYVDGDETSIYITALGDSKFSLSTADGSEFLTANNDNTVVANTASDATSELAQWQFVTKANLNAALASATDASPVDATYNLTEANISRNLRKAYNTSGWTGDFSYGGRNENQCAERYKATTNVYQTVSVRNGKYTVSCQGFYRQESGSAVSYLYANDEQVALNQISSGGINSMDGASDAFSNGEYSNSLTVYVTDGSLKVGIKCDAATNWTIWDNFELRYHGPIIGGEATEIPMDTETAMTADKWYYFDIPVNGLYNLTTTTLSNIVYTTDGTILIEDESDVTNNFSKAENETLSAGRYFIKSSTAQNLEVTVGAYTYAVGSPTFSTVDGGYTQSSTFTVTFTSASTNDPSGEIALVASSKGTVNGDEVDLSAVTNGFSLDLGSLTANTAYRIVIPAEVYGYSGESMNEEIDITIHTPTAFDGFYFLRTSAGKYVARGGDYNSRAVVDEFGLPLSVATNAAGVTQFTYVDNGGKLFLNESGNAYTDNDTDPDWTFEATEGGYYLVHANGKYANNKLNVWSGDSKSLYATGTDGTVFVIEPVSEHNTYMEALKDAQAATAATASGNETITTKAGLTDWLVDNFTTVTVDVPEVSFTEKWNGGASAEWGAGKDMYTNTISSLPEGLYKLTVNAFYRINGSATAAEGARGNTYLYGGSAKTQLYSLKDFPAADAWDGRNQSDAAGYYPDDPTSGAAATASTYLTELYVYHTGGDFTYGIHQPSRFSNQQWFGYQNFTLTRYELKTESVTVTDAGYATYCSENALDFTSTDIKAYVGKISGTTLTFTPINKVPANTGLLLVYEGGKTENVPYNVASADAVDNNCLTGVNEAATLTANDYILNVVGGKAGFYKAGSFTDLAAHRAYISADAGGLVKSFYIDLEDDATGINSLTPALSEGEGAIYNLAGQRMNKMQKGINIVNGKKIMK